MRHAAQVLLASPSQLQIHKHYMAMDQPQCATWSEITCRPTPADIPGKTRTGIHLSRAWGAALSNFLYYIPMAISVFGCVCLGDLFSRKEQEIQILATVNCMNTMLSFVIIRCQRIDRVKRLAYNQKLNLAGKQQRVSTQTKVPSAKHRANDFIDHNTTTHMDLDQEYAVEATFRKPDKFWTICQRYPPSNVTKSSQKAGYHAANSNPFNSQRNGG
ncbi:hypothetical protein DKX38_018323 [Salix brachista]|uniref:Uncharacterized protein n=1 Tax=Salix brachista TaxID=2182728 RepID=A0A5N5KMP9_9ROSI|nr:hypothetical protein DKX38_018323 [Salix brachista]